MTDNDKPRFRFGIRAMLCVVTLIALSLALGPKAYDWYYSVSLSEVVDNFNARQIGDRIGTYQPAVTVEEVLAAIESAKSKLPQDEVGRTAQRAYSRIARNRRLPSDSRLSVNWDGGKAQTIPGDVWLIDLWILNKDRTCYVVKVRTNYTPAITTLP